MGEEARLRFYEELNDYLLPERRKREFSYALGKPVWICRVLQDVGVPESEVELVLVNGTSVDFSHLLSPGDRASFYPVFESFDIRPMLRVRTEPLRKFRFLADPGLRRLALHLRKQGFDVSVSADLSGAEKERQIVLTKNSALLDSGLSRVYVIRERKLGKQRSEILSRLQLDAD